MLDLDSYWNYGARCHLLDLPRYGQARQAQGVQFRFIHCSSLPEKKWKKFVEKIERNQVFVTNSDILVPLSLQPDNVNLWYLEFKFVKSNWIYSLKCLRCTTLGCKYIGNRKSKFVAKTQFLSPKFDTWKTSLRCPF